MIGNGAFSLKKLDKKVDKERKRDKGGKKLKSLLGIPGTGLRSSSFIVELIVSICLIKEFISCVFVRQQSDKVDDEADEEKTTWVGVEGRKWKEMSYLHLNCFRHFFLADFMLSEKIEIN